MSNENPLKKFLGTGNYLARLTFAPNRKNYSSAMKVRIEIFEGRNEDVELDCESISEVASKIHDFYLEKTGMELEVRRLARWFIEYLEDVGITPPEMNILIRDMESTPQELEAREGTEKI
ncbi:MAG: hypothetical protein KGD59_08310 [Candidatus Heimdallarchaeota archaeon]|nr:hypothetical protein [Candidatus Heimdallarchaeota archaeon]MBY8994539.1 hypothetical protein [Candidatus Heimdallarchaeota archaeon]